MFQCTKSQLKNLLFYFENKLQIISNNAKFNGFIVFILHLIFQIISLYILLFTPISYTFYIVIALWSIILLSNFYFRGCFLTKLERHLWNTKTWFGPYYICYDLQPSSTNTIKNIYICQIIFVVTIIFLRVLFKY